MTDAMKPPPRLLDDASVDGEVREGLAELAASEVPFDAAAGLAALKGALAQEASAATAGSATSAGLGAMPWIAGGVVAAMLGGGFYALWPEPPRARAPEHPTVDAPQAPIEQAPAIVAAPVPAKLEPDRVPPASAPRPANVASTTPLEREVALTVRAKHLVDEQPLVALALLRKLDRDHPKGALGEERAGLRVLALWRAGERERARLERDAFLARYPRSPLRERLVRLDEGQGE